MNKYNFTEKIDEQIYYLDATHPDIPNGSLIISKFTINSYSYELDSIIKERINCDINKKEGKVCNLTFTKDKTGNYKYSYDILNEKENTLSKYLGDILTMHRTLLP